MLRSLERTGQVFLFFTGMRIIKFKSLDPGVRVFLHGLVTSMGLRKSQGEEIKIKSKNPIFTIVGQDGIDNG